MSGEDAWDTVGVPLHVKGVQWGLRSGLCADRLSSSFTFSRHAFNELPLCTRPLSCQNGVPVRHYRQLCASNILASALIS